FPLVTGAAAARLTVVSPRTGTAQMFARRCGTEYAMRCSDNPIHSAFSPMRTSGPARRPFLSMGIAYTSPDTPSRSDSIQRNLPSADHAGLLYWKSAFVSAKAGPPEAGNRLMEVGASLPKRGPGSNSIQLPVAHAIHFPFGDHTHECS